jgi:hypothetical protein
MVWIMIVMAGSTKVTQAVNWGVTPVILVCVVKAEHAVKAALSSVSEIVTPA